MAEHPNVALVRAGYAAFASGDLAALDDFLAEDIQWTEAGANAVTGVHSGRAAVHAMLLRLFELSGGTVHLDVHEVLANDTDAVVLATMTGRRGELSVTVLEGHVWRIRHGRAVEYRAAVADQDAVDALFA
jgi:ketosteroid isomerase-like protein